MTPPPLAADYAKRLKDCIIDTMSFDPSKRPNPSDILRTFWSQQQDDFGVDKSLNIIPITVMKRSSRRETDDEKEKREKNERADAKTRRDNSEDAAAEGRREKEPAVHTSRWALALEESRRRYEAKQRKDAKKNTRSSRRKDVRQ
jgi:hypothetical protein